MKIFFENAIRGGLSMITHKYAKANNPLLEQIFNPGEPNSYKLYQDCKYLYRNAMKMHGVNITFCPSSLGILVVLVRNVTLRQFVIKVCFGRKRRFFKSAVAIHVGIRIHPFSQ
jgi:hypothetical protein